MRNELQKLLLRGMRGSFSATDTEIITEIASGIKSGRYKVFVLENAAFCILYMPDNPLENPQVLHFYSEKSHLRRPLVSHVLDFVNRKGYTKLKAMNNSGVDDAIWTRAFRHPGWKINPIRTVFEFEVING